MDVNETLRRDYSVHIPTQSRDSGIIYEEEGPEMGKLKARRGLVRGRYMEAK